MNPGHQTRRILWILAVATAGLNTASSAASAQTGLTAEHKAALADTIAAVATQFGTAFARVNWQEMQPFLADDFQYYWVGEKIAGSRAEFEHIFHRYIAVEAREYSVTTMREEQVMILGPDAAVTSSVFEGTATSPAGVAAPVTGAVSVIYARRDGGWKVVHMHESRPMPRR